MTARYGGIDRREFLARCSAASLAAVAGGRGLLADEDTQKALPTRPLGKTGLAVPMLVFGGGSQFLKGGPERCEKLLKRALDLGVTFFDTAMNYRAPGRPSVPGQTIYGRVLPEHREKILVSTKILTRSPERFGRQFKTCLERLKMDRVDILFLHSLGRRDTARRIAGVLAEARKLKEKGQARFIGVSSHTSPARVKEAIEAFDLDVVLVAINPTRYKGFAGTVLPAARKKQVGVLAMKTLRDVVGRRATAEELLGYALGQEGVAGAVVGHPNAKMLEENIATVRQIAAAKRSPEEQEALERRFRSFPRDALSWARPGYRDGDYV